MALTLIASLDDTSYGIIPSSLLSVRRGHGRQRSCSCSFKRSFTQLGCMGDFDRSKFARLDSVCEECYELYREPDIHFNAGKTASRTPTFPNAWMLFFSPVSKRNWTTLSGNCMAKGNKEFRFSWQLYKQGMCTAESLNALNYCIISSFDFECE
ncbi:hypothetical protein CEXT_786701 [Caerostris extrusa]|uniref:Uncharacterized protein n=1 Tax=Caerostris extrusa TaxID=172846 RepID=A0AAV4M7X1_CAEEX|nr:hypothetical protein CEXT_786701 [Caerostris extrusa]